MNVKNRKKLIALLVATCSSQTFAITSTMTHRTMGTSPLLYKMMDYAKQQTCFEIAPIYSGMYDATRVNENIILNGQNSLVFDQQGNGDLNPTWLNLISNNTLADYASTVTFSPMLTQSGALFHWYSDFDNMFVDARTALVQTKTEVAISEVGGGNGLNPGVLNAQQAFTQSDWNYGKIGQANHVVGLDNIELRIGGVYKATSDASTYDLLFAGFGIIEAPTGSGTTAEWLFEPQVGTNHWGLGLGFESLVSGDDDLKFMVAANYRYLIPAWETRSFDLLDNGQWSRYLAVQDTYGLPTAPPTLGLPGINYFTQQAYINGRSELNVYLRLQKQFRSSYFELSYNFLCVQKETIGAIKAINSGYGLYALTGPAGGSGGVTTSSTAMINQDTTTLDALGSPIELTTANFDKLSAAQSTYATNNITARLEIDRKNVIYGFGASIESALSASAISTWSVWAQFGFMFDNIVTSCDHHEFSPELYDLETTTPMSVYHAINMDEAGLPQDVIAAIKSDFIEKNDNFEFEDNFEFNDAFDFNATDDNNEMSDAAQKDFIASKIAELNCNTDDQEDDHNDVAIEESINNDEISDEESNEDVTYNGEQATDDTNQPAKENQTIALEDDSVAPITENGFDLQNDDAQEKSETISLDDHEVVIQSDSGVHLQEHSIKTQQAQPMSADEIAQFMKHSKA